MSGDSTWKSTQERTGFPNNTRHERAEGLTRISSVGNTALRTTAETTDGKRWMLGTTPDRSENEDNSLGRTRSREERERL